MHNGKLWTVGAMTALAALVVVALAAPARAADPIYPFGSRIGLVPPAGMVASDKFAGFADPDKNAAILIVALPLAAYDEMTKTLETATFKKQGMTVDKHEPMKLRVGKGTLFIGRQVAEKERFRKWILIATAGDLTAFVTIQVPEGDNRYPEAALRAALATLSVRESVPVEEQLKLLPFTIGDLAGFRVNDVVPGRAIVLEEPPGEGSKEASKPAAENGIYARLLIAAIQGGPSEPDERANFARLAFNEIGGIKDIHVTVSEPLRIGGQPGYQTMAEAKDARTGTDLRVIQWLRFGGGGFLQMVGISPAEHWTSVLARLRTVRDSVEIK